MNEDSLLVKIGVIIVSFITTFMITFCGSMFLVLIQSKGVMPDKLVWIGAVLLSLGTGAKDTRSLLKLPPVAAPSTGNTDQITKP